MCGGDKGNTIMCLSHCLSSFKGLQGGPCLEETPGLCDAQVPETCLYSLKPCPRRSLATENDLGVTSVQGSQNETS